MQKQAWQACAWHLSRRSVKRSVTCWLPQPVIAPGYHGGDIGPASQKLFEDAISDAGTVFWNGPLGERLLAAVHGTALQMLGVRCS